MGLKRKYLNAQEQNNIMCLFAVMQQLEGIRSMMGKASGIPMWEEWEKRGVLSKEAKKYLKTAHTYLDKFRIELINNLDEEAVNTLEKKLKKFDLTTIDGYKLAKINRDINNKLKYVIMDRRVFDDFIPEVAQINCVGCKEEYCGCAIYKAYQDAMLPAVGGEPNCPYASDLSKYTPEELKRLEETKARIKSKNIFFKEGK